jgi:hypothetical protein
MIPKKTSSRAGWRATALFALMIKARHKAAALLLCCILPTLSNADIEAPRDHMTITLGPKTPAEVNRVTAQSIAIEGKITPAVVTKFSTMVNSDTTTLYIYSSGGDPESSRALGRLIHNQHITVTVVGSCAAACAKYVFVAGTHRVISPGSLVGFSETAASIDLITSSSPDRGIHRAYEPEIVADQSYYRELGLPERLLYDPHEMMHPQCYVVLRKVQSPTDVLIVNQYGLVVLPKSYFDDIGVEVAGAWPSSPEEFIQAGKLVKPGASVGLLWKTNVRPLEDVKATLEKVASCSAEQKHAFGLAVQ